MIPFFHPFIHIPYYLMLWYPPYLSLGLSTWLPLANDASKCDTGRTWKNVFPPFHFCHYAWARLLNTLSSIQAELQQAAVKSYRNWEEPPIQVSANNAPQGGIPGPLHPANTSLAIISLPWFHLIAPITIEIVSLVSLCAHLLFSPLESLVRRLVIRSDHQNSYRWYDPGTHRWGRSLSIGSLDALSCRWIILLLKDLGKIQRIPEVSQYFKH